MGTYVFWNENQRYILDCLNVFILFCLTKRGLSAFLKRNDGFDVAVELTEYSD